MIYPVWRKQDITLKEGNGISQRPSLDGRGPVILLGEEHEISHSGKGLRQAEES